MDLCRGEGIETKWRMTWKLAFISASLGLRILGARESGSI